MITRKAFGGAYDVMGSKHLGADINVAWPTAQIAVMGAQGAANILHRKKLAKADDPEALRAELVQEYEDHAREPLRGGRARLRRHRALAVAHPGLRDPGPAHAQEQAREPAAEEAREHPAVSDACGARMS